MRISLILLSLSFVSQVQAAPRFCDWILRGGQGQLAPVESDIKGLARFKAQWDSQKGLLSGSLKKRGEEALTHLLEDLGQVTESSSLKDQKIKTYIEEISEKLDGVVKSYQELVPEDRKARYFKETYEALWSALTLHSHELLEAHSKDLDYPRYFTILKAINEFDETKPRFSFYKIRRAIEGRFSMSEFIRCRL